MNQAQKGAWLCLIGGIITVILIGMMSYVLLTGCTPEKVNLLCHFTVPFIVAYTIFFLYAIRKKRNPNEPDVDERDRQISLKAIRICLLSLCLLIYFSDAAIMLFTGLDGWIPSSALPVVHFGIGYLAFTVYYAAVLILYGKDNKLPEGGDV